MHIARSFSTSLWRARQPLYEPYVARLNEEQKKALRKVIAKSMPSYHSKLNPDIAHLLRAYEVVEGTPESRKKTVEHVKQIIQSAFGSDYSVIDRSLSNYARDYEYAPLELAVYDESRPTGLPPGTEGEPLPDPYKHEVLAELLQQHGYVGSFVAGDAIRTLPPLDPGVTPSSGPSEERGPLPATPPWPSYSPYPTRYLTYPPVLFAEHTSGATSPFFLSPPVPTHMPLIRLLRTYTAMNESIPHLITLLILWTRSIDLPQLTPTCIALMVIGWLQHKHSLMSLQNPSDPLQVHELAQKDEGVWFRGSHPLEGQTDKVFWLETAFVTSPPSKPTSKLGPLLLDFFSFWSQDRNSSGFISTSQYLSVREGTVKRRSKPTTKNTGTVLKEDDRLIAEGRGLSSLNEQPIVWQAQPIVIQDPFIPTFNHAQTMSKAACNYFHRFCALSSRTIRHSHPLTTILGPHLPPPSKKIHRNLGVYRPYSTTAPIGRDMKLIYEANIPPLPVLEARNKTISRVQKAIRKGFGGQYSVECFGSTRYGAGSVASDLDLVIIDRERIDGFSPEVDLRRLPDIYDIKLVASTLYKNGFCQVFAIPKATVPIVKFRDPATGLDCDLNTNDQLGLWNTQLISRYCDLAPDLVRPMIMAIKRWAKSHGMNDPSGQYGPVTFSSYALVLMVIGFLQVKGALPNLQAGLESLPNEAKQGAFWMRTKSGGKVRCDTRFVSGDGWTPERRLDLDEALTGWFTFWAHEHKYDKQLLSVREGGLVKRVKKKKKDRKPKPEEKKNMTQQEEQEERSAQEEDAIVAAFANESESEESEDAEKERQEVVEVIDMAAEMSNEAADQGQQREEAAEEIRDEAVEMKADGTLAEGQQCDVPPAAEVGIRPEEVEVELANSGLQGTEQPSKWKSDALVVADPFILAKNVCGNVGRSNIGRFEAECRRSVQLLSWGEDLEDLMGDGEPLPGPGPIRGRGGRGRRGEKGGRGGRGGRAAGSAPGQSDRAQYSDHEQRQDILAGGRGRRGEWGVRDGRSFEPAPVQSGRVQDGDQEQRQEGSEGVKGKRGRRGGRGGRIADSDRGDQAQVADHGQRQGGGDGGRGRGWGRGGPTSRGRGAPDRPWRRPQAAIQPNVATP